MEYDDTYTPAMDIILPTISRSKPSKMAVIYPLYDDIHSGLGHAQNLINSGMITKTVLQGKSLIFPIKSKYIPYSIYETIKEKLIEQLEYTFVIGERTISIRIGKLSDAPIDLAKMLLTMFSWLYVCDKYSDKQCGKKQIINIYLSNFKKQLPSNGEILGPYNVNSAYSTVCKVENDICIFREEEWFKVFIHETFHSYGFDLPKLANDQIASELAVMCSLQSTILVSESYVETWSRIINAIYNSILNSDSKKECMRILDFSLQVEGQFSVIQSSRVLAHMNITYVDLINKSISTEFRENSNVFAYYILSAAMMHNPYTFILWCKKHNTDHIFKLNNHSINSFITLMRDTMHDTSLISYYKSIQPITNMGARFSIIDAV